MNLNDDCAINFMLAKGNKILFRGYLGAPLIIAAGVLADLIAKSGKYKSFKKTALSLFGALGTLPPATSALLHNTSTVLLGMDCMTNLLQDTKKP